MVKKNWSTVGEVMWLIMAIWKQLLRHNIRSMQSIYYPLSHHHVSPVLRCLLSTQNVLLQPTTRLILPHTSILSLTYTCAPRVISHGVGGRSFHKNSRADDRKRGKRITAKQMLVIDEDGRSLGVMDKRVALRVAEEKALELVQVCLLPPLLSHLGLLPFLLLPTFSHFLSPSSPLSLPFLPLKPVHIRSCCYSYPIHMCTDTRLQFTVCSNRHLDSFSCATITSDCGRPFW